MEAPRLLPPVVSHKTGILGDILRDGLAGLFSTADPSRVAAFSAPLWFDRDEAVSRRDTRTGLVSVLSQDPNIPYYGSLAFSLQAKEAIERVVKTGCFDLDVLHVAARKGEPVFALFTPWCVVLQTQKVLRYAGGLDSWQGTRAPHVLATLCFPEAKSAHQRIEQARYQDRALRLLLRARPHTQDALDLLGIGFSFPTESVPGA